jgi:hypothetical protein
MQLLSEVVLDTSALLALINEEPGADKVWPLMAKSMMSTVNFCETVYKLRRRGLPVETVKATLTPLVLTFRTSPDDYPRISPRAKSGGGIHGQCGSLARPCAGGLCRAS